MFIIPVSSWLMSHLITGEQESLAMLQTGGVCWISMQTIAPEQCLGV